MYFTPLMKELEKYYGVKIKRKFSLHKLISNSQRYISKQKAEKQLKEANRLFVRGAYDQALGLLENIIKLNPMEHKAFYLLGLIHEERGNAEKAATSYYLCAAIKNNDTSMWKKALFLTSQIKDEKRQIQALEKICRKEPTRDLLTQKLECLQSLNKKYWTVGCEIELFSFNGVDNSVFEKFENLHHKVTLKMITSKLARSIVQNKDAQTEFFVRNTILAFYRSEDWDSIVDIYNEHYQQYSQDMPAEMIIVMHIAAKKSSVSAKKNELFDNNPFRNNTLWTSMPKKAYVIDLAEFYESICDIPAAIEIYDILLEKYECSEYISKIGDLYALNGNDEEALNSYLEALSADPTNIEAKAKVYEIHKTSQTDLGHSQNELDPDEYQIASDVYRHKEENERVTKSEFRFPQKKCKEMRMKYDLANNVLRQNPADFPKHTKELLDDFFSNAFVTLKYKNFDTFKEQHEKATMTAGLIGYEEIIKKRNETSRLIRISSLHGLDVEEWLYVVKQTVYIHISLGEYQKANDIIFKAVEASVFKKPEFLLQLYFLGFKINLNMQNLDNIISIVRKMAFSYDPSALYLLFFFVQFFKDYFMSTRWSEIVRTFLKSLKNKSLNATGGSQEMDTSRSFLVASLQLPRYLYNVTFENISKTGQSEDAGTRTVSAATLLLHSKSRLVKDRMKYAKEGIKILTESPNSASKMYNIAKAYHFYGYFAQAEKYYLKVIEGPDAQLKKMAIFNLSLIFKKNKSKNIYKHVLSKFDS
ncbi:hypothetical protein ENBRE01_1882 [Enteropsectra breve]|nr:hypothetical protein ENBRE01_1882 [Enteropsectra breve]